jgi:prepilin-type N-terminal cleavage/methylation domain-containing protein
MDFSPRPKTTVAAAGFTLLELLVVVGIILLMMGLAAPTFQALNQPRKKALQELKAELESARTLALKEQTDVYVAFTDGSPSSQTHQFRRYGVFKADPSDPDPDPLRRRLVQVGGWSDLGEGVVFALGESFEVSSGDPLLTLLEARLKRPFLTPLEGGVSEGEASAPSPGVWVLPFLMYGREGTVQVPQFFDRDFLHIGVMDGYVEEREPVPTRMRAGVELDQEFPQADCLQIDLYSGRARLVTE